MCSWIQNAIKNGLTEGHYIEVYGHFKYGNLLSHSRFKPDIWSTIEKIKL